MVVDVQDQARSPALDLSLSIAGWLHREFRLTLGAAPDFELQVSHDSLLPDA